MRRQDWQRLRIETVRQAPDARIVPHAWDEFPWIAWALDPIANLLGPPKILHSAIACDSYGGPPQYGILISWNMAEEMAYERGLNADLVPIDPAKPAVGLLVGYYQNSSCIARVMPHPTWRLRLSDHWGDRYHTLDEFVARCLETLDAPRPVDMFSDKVRMGIAAGWIRPPKGMI